MNNEILDIEKETQLISNMYKTLLESKKLEVDMNFDMKTLEEQIKYDIATEKQYSKKNGDLDLAKVKMNLIKTAIMIDRFEKDNKIAENYEILEEYLSDFNNETYNMSLIDSYERKINLLNDQKITNKEIVGKYTGVLQKETVSAVQEIVKIMIKKYKNEADDKFREEHDKPAKKEKNVSAIDEEILKIAEKLGISL